MPSMESRLAVGEVVHRVDAPLVAGAVMLGVEDAVHDRVAQVEVGGGHVDLGAQRARAVGEFAGAHALEQVQVLFDGAVAVGAFLARLGQRAAVLADLVRGQVADVGLARLDQLHRPLVQLVEVIGGVEQAVFPIEAQPADVVHDGIDVLGLFLLGVGVVEAQVGLAAELRRQAEVEADGLGVADVQVAVGLGRKARVHAAAVLVGLQIVEDDVADEIRSAAGGDASGGTVGLEGFIFLSTFEWPDRCAGARSRGPAPPGFRTAAARSCARTPPRGWAGTSGRS